MVPQANPDIVARISANISVFAEPTFQQRQKFSRMDESLVLLSRPAIQRDRGRISLPFSSPRNGKERASDTGQPWSRIEFSIELWVHSGHPPAREYDAIQQQSQRHKLHMLSGTECFVPIQDLVVAAAK